MVCGIKCAFDLHPDWVVLQIDMDNALNYVSRRVMFQELRVVEGEITQLVLSILTFYVLNPLYIPPNIFLNVKLPSSH
jgi:hypothetical protein